MKTLKWLLALLGIIGLTWGCMRPGHGPELIIGLYENAPKVYTAPNGKPAGLFVELIEAAARAEGWRLHYLPCQWSDCLAKLENGEIDLMPDVAFSTERAQKYDFHRVSVANSWSQIYSHPDLVIHALPDLAGMRVALLQGGIQQKFFAQLVAGNQIPYEPILVNSLDAAYQAVQDGQADVVVTNSFFAAHNGHKYQLLETPIVFLPSTLYFAAPKGKHADLLRRIDAHLIGWRQDADSIYFDALHRAMAAPPEILVPRWVQWSLFGLLASLLALGVISLVLRRQVEQRTAELRQTADQLQLERDNLEHIVNQRTAELRAAKEEAEHLSHVKSDFLANMSHEIRTPMNAILGMLYLALKNELPPNLRNHLSKAQGAAHSLLGIINDILDFSKIEAGKLNIEQIEFGLDSVLEQLADTVSYQAESKGIEFLIRYDPAIPARLIGDPLRLGQILLNLCGNAIKFTTQGEVELAFRCLSTSETTITIQVCVRDSGIGMTPDAQQKLFQKFSQADQTTTRRFGGTGLGLAIAKNLCELMGGRIWVEDSQPGKGTTICFTAQLGIAQQAQARQRQLVEQAGPLLQGIRVLVVDDNEVSREILAEMLRFFRLDVGMAANGPAALAAIKSAHKAENEAPYDLVLMDWRMPGMNGDEVTQRIHSDSTLARQPKVVMITAYGREDVIRLSEQAGVDGFLIKPVSPSTLLDTILSVLGRGRIFGTDASGGRHAVPDLASSGKLAGARLLLVEDNDINREFACELLKNEGIVVDEAENGLIAVAKVQQQDYDAVLMDIQMPEMDGLEAARQIRALAQVPGGERFAQLPIIAMTALAMAQDAEKSSAAGMNDHVTKPIAPDRLMAALSQWVKLPGNRPTTATSPAPTADNASSSDDFPAELAALTSLATREGVRRIGGKVAAYRKQLLRFREHYANAIDELRRLITEKGLSAAEEYCHALKGVAGNLGAQALFEATTTIDDQLKRQQAPDADTLADAERLLQQVLHEIDSLSQAEIAVVPAGPQLNREAAQLLLQRLAHAIEFDLGAAEALLNELRAGLASTPLETDIAEVAALVDIFDIDAAMARLTLMEPRLDELSS